jgi:hypothetical protein
MACETYVIVVKTKNGKTEQLSLGCAGRCPKDKSCKPEFFNPDLSTTRIYKTCYCDEEVEYGPPACNSTMKGHGTKWLNRCKIAAVHKLGSGGIPEEEAYSYECIGKCKDDKKCKTKNLMRRELEDGRVLELWMCECP